MELKPQNLSARVRASLGARSDDPRRSDLVRVLLEYSFQPASAGWGRVLSSMLTLFGLAALVTLVWPGLVGILPRWLILTVLIVIGLLIAMVALGVRYGHQLDYSIGLVTIEEEDPNADPESPGDTRAIERIDHFRLGNFGELLSLDNSLIKVLVAFVLMLALALVIFLWDEHLGFQPAPENLIEAMRYAAGTAVGWLFSLLEMQHWVQMPPSPSGTWNKVIVVGFRFLIDGLLVLAAIQAYQTLRIRWILRAHGSAAVTLPDPNMYAFRQFPDEVMFITVASHFAGGDMQTARAFASLCPKLGMSDEVRALFASKRGPIFPAPPDTGTD